MIYFDHNATTPVDERVVEVMLPFLHHFYGNPSSLYRLGRLSRTAIESAREQVAALVGAAPDQIVFTSGGTEANNLAISQIKNESRVALSAIEHPSVSAPIMARQQQFKKVLRLKVDTEGRVDSEYLQSLEWGQNDFVSVMLANNETGVIQDVNHLVEMLRPKGVVIHSDAVQAFGKTPFSFEQLGVQLLSLSSHKIYGPKGCGALVVDKDFNLLPMMHGGGQEQGRRGGTENVAAIVGFGKAAELALSELEVRTEQMLCLRDFLEQQLDALPGVTVFSRNAERLPNTVQFAIQGIDGEMLQMQLDQKNIAVSSGSACSSGGGEASPVLIAMDVEESLAKGAIRVSLGKGNTRQEIEQFIDELKKITG